jgi:hypothetical protein
MEIIDISVLNWMDGKAKVGETKRSDKLADRNIQCFSVLLCQCFVGFLACAVLHLCTLISVVQIDLLTDKGSFVKKKKKSIVSI